MSFQKEKRRIIEKRSHHLRMKVFDFFEHKFIRNTNSLLIGIVESNDDMEKTKKEIENLRDQLNQLKLKISKEHQAGKDDSVLAPLKKKWQDIQSAIKNAWKRYDDKHGTKYSKHYED